MMKDNKQRNAINTTNDVTFVASFYIGSDMGLSAVTTSTRCCQHYSIISSLKRSKDIRRS